MIRTAYLVREDGVTPIRFRCEGDQCTNLDEIQLDPDAWIDFGNGWTMTVCEVVDALED